MIDFINRHGCKDAENKEKIRKQDEQDDILQHFMYICARAYAES